VSALDETPKSINRNRSHRTGKQTEDLPAKMKQEKKTNEAVTGRAPGLRAGTNNA
jgi:hypothetical protein